MNTSSGIFRCLSYLEAEDPIGTLIREHDWSSTSLGAAESWSQPLITLVGIMLGSNQPMFTVWGADRILLYNVGYAAILGGKHPAAMGRHFFEVWPEFVDVVTPIMNRAYGGEPTHMDDICRDINRHGHTEEPHLKFSFTPVRDESGAVAGVFCPCVEITEKMRAERALRQSERRLSAIFAQAAVGLSEIGLDGRFLRVNDDLCRMLGRSREQLLTLGVPDVTLPLDVATCMADLRQLIETGQPLSVDKRYVRPDGSLVWANSIISRLDDDGGNPISVLAVTVDLTERHRAEGALRDSEERFRATFENAAVGIGHLGLDGRWLRVNGRLCEIVGYPREELLTKSFADITHPDDLECNWSQIERLLAGEIFNYGMEMRYLCQDGATVWVNLTVSSTGELAGGEKHLIAVVEDIRDRKAAEKALVLADRRKNEFLATLAHELRNPLAPLRLGLQVLRPRRADSDVFESTLDSMERQLRQLVRLVDDLLDIARITQGKVQVCKERCELQRILSSALESSRPLLDESGVELNIDIPWKPVEVEADHARLVQAFSNLLINAGKYTERGGHVWLQMRPQDDRVVVSVRDTGIGIAPDEISRVFEMFTQFNDSRGSPHAGQGIGLALVRALVERHGGTVEAHSPGLGRGSEFVVRLPIMVPIGPCQDLRSTTPTRPLEPGHRILVVDDNEDAANLMGVMLESMGYEIRKGHDGLEAVVLAEKFRPELVLLDIGLPKLNGYEAARRIREQPWGKDMLLVALTGWGQEEDRQRSAEAGFDRHYVKPIETDVLDSLLRALSSDPQDETTLPRTLQNGLSWNGIYSGRIGGTLDSSGARKPHQQSDG